MNLHEELFVKSFIIAAKRERYLSLLSSVKGRKKLLNDLDHLRDLDENKIIHISPAQQNPFDICGFLQAKGAGKNCYVISTNSALDTRELALSEALEEIVGYGFGSYVSTIAGKLGYYEGEEPGDRYILEA